MVLLLVILTGGNTAKAQYNPENPPEPAIKYKVKVSVSPAGAGYASGAGSFLKGQTTSIYTSRNNDYVFQYWTKNGVKYSESSSFVYTMEAENADFVAVYQYNPSNPDDPAISQSYPLYLDCSPKDACSFNRTSGMKTKKDTWVYISATPNQGFDFLGWYENNTKISSNLSFQYQMKGQECTLVAKFNYNPDNPGEPATQQTNVDNTPPPGDANNDGIVNVADIVEIANAIKGNPSAKFKLAYADLNKNGKADTDDIKAVANIIMKKN